MATGDFSRLPSDLLSTVLVDLVVLTCKKDPSLDYEVVVRKLSMVSRRWHEIVSASTFRKQLVTRIAIVAPSQRFVKLAQATKLDTDCDIWSMAVLNDELYVTCGGLYITVYDIQSVVSRHQFEQKRRFSIPHDDEASDEKTIIELEASEVNNSLYVVVYDDDDYVDLYRMDPQNGQVKPGWPVHESSLTSTAVNQSGHLICGGLSRIEDDICAEYDEDGKLVRSVKISEFLVEESPGKDSECPSQWFAVSPLPTEPDGFLVRRFENEDNQWLLAKINCNDQQTVSEVARYQHRNDAFKIVLDVNSNGEISILECWDDEAGDTELNIRMLSSDLQPLRDIPIVSDCGGKSLGIPAAVCLDRKRGLLFFQPAECLEDHYAKGLFVAKLVHDDFGQFVVNSG